MIKRFWALWSTQDNGKRIIIALYNTEEYSKEDVEYLAYERQAANPEHYFNHAVSLRSVK